MALEAFHSAEEWGARFGARGQSVLTVGNFDGIHLGHQAILRSVTDRARALGAVSTVVTFDPPPLKVLRPESAPPRISTTEQRVEWFRKLDLDSAMILRFDEEFARISPDDFAVRLLLGQLCMRAILVGENFRFGHRHAGDAKLLRELGNAHGFAVEIVPPVLYRGEVVSSTAVRRAVSEGKVGHAAKLLGRPFALTGEVRPGSGIGGRLVFPTLNLAPEQELLPAIGVYATETVVDGRSHQSVTNVGRRPTFNGSSLAVESHLLDFSEKVTRGRMEIHFCERLRDEKKFRGPEELRRQISRDIARARRFFARAEGARATRQTV
jgi:riboflavin kinase/FMN adenylyltransferase